MKKSFVCKMDENVLIAFRYFCKLHNLKVEEKLQEYVEKELNEKNVKYKQEKKENE